MKTTLRQNVTSTDRKWFVMDATDQTLGKLSTLIATKLCGTDRTDFTPHVDGGDYVVILNAEKVAVSGNKELDKKYYSHSGYLGNLKTKNLAEIREKNPLKIIEHSVNGMLPKNRHRKDRMQRLKLIIGTKNPYEAQKPETLTLNNK